MRSIAGTSGPEPIVETRSGCGSVPAEAEVHCAWCAHFGRRPSVSARSAAAGGGTPAGTHRVRETLPSHGLCRECLPLLLREWGLTELREAENASIPPLAVSLWGPRAGA
jgi:hypothetical protein